MVVVVGLWGYILVHAVSVFSIRACPKIQFAAL